MIKRIFSIAIFSLIFFFHSPLLGQDTLPTAPKDFRIHSPYNDSIYQTVPFTSSFAMVYVRVPRTLDVIDYVRKGVTTEGVRNWDIRDQLPETSFRIQGMNGPGQLIYRARDGTETILYDCMDKTPACLPMDPTVSFDGKKVIFSVLEGEIKKDIFFSNVLPMKRMKNTTHARLYIADIPSGTITPLPHQAGAFDTGPVFLPDGNIMFTSTRANELRTSHSYFTQNDEPVLQLWLADGTGNNARRIGPQDRDGSLHPIVMSDGRVLFSTWQLSHNAAHRGSIGKGIPSAQDNHFWVASIDHTGGHWNAVFGKHGKQVRSHERIHSMKALHFFAEMANGWLCTTNYYRKNNLGSGNIICWERENIGIEGRGPSEESDPGLIFTPRNMISAFLWASSSDSVSGKFEGEETRKGKVRDPAALPGNQMLLTYAKGLCSGATGTTANLAFQDDPIGCDTGIYKTTKIPSEHSNDLVKIVDLPEWHEFMAKVAEPYSYIYNIEKPKIPEIQRDSQDRCLFASSSAIVGEVDHVVEHEFNAKNPPCATQGCKVREIPMSMVKALRFWEVMPNTDKNVQKARLRSTIGHRLKLLGDVAPLADGSIAVELPCETPFVLAGVDKDGHTILRDQIPQALRTGEIRTCRGCHMHSKPGPKFEGTLASKFENVPALGKGIVPIIKNGTITEISSAPILLEYKKDVYPILQNRCASCHSGLNAADGLRLDIPGTGLAKEDLPSTWYRITWDNNRTLVPNLYQQGGKNLDRPNSSMYMNNSFALESLLYWKAANARLDNRTDSQRQGTISSPEKPINENPPGDINFGESHPTGMTDDELRVLRDWIEAGAYAEVDDPQ